jgi:hypothetical protein
MAGGSTARTAVWHDADRLDIFCCRHCSEAMSPGGSWRNAPHNRSGMRSASRCVAHRSAPGRKPSSQPLTGDGSQHAGKCRDAFQHADILAFLIVVAEAEASIELNFFKM